MLCMARVRLDYDPNAIKCYAFGAPPVLSLSEKTAAQNVMSVGCCPLPTPPGHALRQTLRHVLFDCRSLTGLSKGMLSNSSALRARLTFCLTYQHMHPAAT